MKRTTLLLFLPLTVLAQSPQPADTSPMVQQQLNGAGITLAMRVASGGRCNK